MIMKDGFFEHPARSIWSGTPLSPTSVFPDPTQSQTQPTVRKTKTGASARL